ncbi:c-type cytochrome [Humisphaera borealis]|uniref:C-type cytochrome n=1 Tax=Humisphaera borealis TaxID=2807512 RepID=A0A7M2WZG1_9BACT|nr:c-type cytochrome [Humisphaera borealis]QOV90582.1 c-type cytochrome [Humisphaera borealis]
MLTRTLLCILAIGLFSLAVHAQAPAVGSDQLVLDEDTGISLRPGFDAELIYEVPKSQGSWVAMAFDPKGRLIVSDQDDKGVFRVTLPTATSRSVKVESLPGFPYEPIPWGKRTVGGALGFLYAFDSLYMSNMRGFYRIRDTDGDDEFDEFTLLKKLNVGYEHSAHSIIQTADGKGLYLVSGNFTRTPAGTASVQPPVWLEDSLIPSIPDPMGHAVGLKPPGGWICRISPDGADWKMIASRFRNSVDIALNREGELFTYDSDMEFDVGCPWYRPTRINHVTSGSEFGWRSGSGVWLDYFADSNGSVLDIGPGSPTAISFGHHSNFPAEFQDKLFICDWTFGTIFTVEMKESGSTYTGTKAEFLHGSPLNVAAMRFGPDGAMYFLTGGRTTASRLYRVRYTGSAKPAVVRTPPAPNELRALRHSLEKLHVRAEPGDEVIATAWPHLSHADRNIRYAARIAIECQDVSLWREKVFAESNPRAVIYSGIALCRHGDKSLSRRLLDKLGEVPFAILEKEDRLALLRAYALCFMRMDKPAGEQASAVIARLDAHYPSADDTVNAELWNAELCRVLAALDAPTVVKKTIELMKSTRAETVSYDKTMLERHEYGAAILKMMANTPNARNIHYANSLSRVRSGWTIEARKYYFGWLNEALEKDGGKSFAGYIRAIRTNAIAHLETAEVDLLGGLLSDFPTFDLSKLPKARGPGQEWTVEKAMKLSEPDLRGRNFENGKRMFSAGFCIVCHRVGGEGGHSGPDLGSLSSRYSIRDILVAIVEPSASISEQYMARTVKLKKGDPLSGRLIYRNEKEIGVASNPFDLNQITKAPADDVQSIEFSNISMMPSGLILGMNRDELMDLMAYLLSGGNPQHKAFAKD